MAPASARKQRQGVTAEAHSQTATGPKEPENAFKTKSEDLVTFIKNAVHGNILFDNLTADHLDGIVRVMYREHITQGTSVITQGDVGELFYVVEAGQFEIFVNGKNVARRGPGQTFGELALMYNAPRAATVTASVDSTLWVVHRQTFRWIVTSLSQQQFSKYTDFVEQVDLLQPLSPAQKESVAAALEEVRFEPNEVIFNKGDEGDKMYIVQSGECLVTINGTEVQRCKAGDYFGERSLLKSDVRAATVTAGPAPVVCASLDRNNFTSLLGSLEALMTSRLASYATPYPADAKGTTAASGGKTIPFGRLTTVGTLGKGSFGYVQLVQDKETGTTFALKAVNKAMIVATGQKGHIMSEKNVMAALDHQFCIKLFQTYKDQNRLYLLLEPVLGGELFTILRTYDKFDNETTRFYAANVIAAFEYMHSLDIIYRDLKPENLLVTHDGYLKITDFGFAKKLTSSQTYTLCGTPDYLAPEIVTGKGHGKGVDWWTVGILIYEMLASIPPFYDDDPMKTYSKIISGDINFPEKEFDARAVKIVKRLLHHKPVKRLGVTKGGAKKIREHAWYDGFSWDDLFARKIKPSIIPDIQSATDLSNFEEVEEEEEVPEYVDEQDDWDADF